MINMPIKWISGPRVSIHLIKVVLTFDFQIFDSPDNIPYNFNPSADAGDEAVSPSPPVQPYIPSI